MLRRLPLAPEPERPKTRADCVDGPRPCPWASCRYHLLVDITEDGRLYRNHPFDEDDDDSILAALATMTETCALDVAAGHGVSLTVVGELLGQTKQSVEFVEFRALRRLEVLAEHPDDPYLELAGMTAEQVRGKAALLRRLMAKPDRDQGR